MVRKSTTKITLALICLSLVSQQAQALPSAAKCGKVAVGTTITCISALIAISSFGSAWILRSDESLEAIKDKGTTLPPQFLEHRKTNFKTFIGTGIMGTLGTILGIAIAQS